MDMAWALAGLGAGGSEGEADDLVLAHQREGLGAEAVVVEIGEEGEQGDLIGVERAIDEGQQRHGGEGIDAAIVAQLDALAVGVLEHHRLADATEATVGDEGVGVVARERIFELILDALDDGGQRAAGAPAHGGLLDHSICRKERTMPTLQHNGATINYRESGEGDVLLLLHAAGSTSGQWRGFTHLSYRLLSTP